MITVFHCYGVLPTLGTKDWNVKKFRQYFGEISLIGRLQHNIRHRLSVDGNFGNFLKISPIFRYLSVYLPIFRKISRYFLPVQPAHRIQNLSNFFFKKKTNIRCYLVIWSWFAGKGCVFQPGSKIVDLGFVKFKSNGTTAKRPLEQIQKTQGAKE